MNLDYVKYLDEGILRCGECEEVIKVDVQGEYREWVVLTCERCRLSRILRSDEFAFSEYAWK